MMRWYKKTFGTVPLKSIYLFAGFKEQTHQRCCGMGQSAQYARAVSPGCTAVRGYNLGKFEICDAQLDPPLLSKDEVVMLLVEKPDEGALGSVSFLTNVAQGF